MRVDRARLRSASGSLMVIALAGCSATGPGTETIFRTAPPPTSASELSSLPGTVQPSPRLTSSRLDRNEVTQAPNRSQWPSSTGCFVRSSTIAVEDDLVAKNPCEIRGDDVPALSEEMADVRGRTLFRGQWGDLPLPIGRVETDNGLIVMSTSATRGHQ